MGQTAQSTVETTQKPIKPTSIKILQWVYLALGLIGTIFTLAAFVKKLELFSVRWSMATIEVFLLFFLANSLLSILISGSFFGFTEKSPNKWSSRSVTLLLIILVLWLLYSGLGLASTISCWGFPSTGPGGLNAVPHPCIWRPTPEDYLLFIIIFLIPLFIFNLYSLIILKRNKEN